MSCPRKTARRAYLRGLGLDQSAENEILAYNENRFLVAAAQEDSVLPLADEPFVSDWDEFARMALHGGVPSTLRHTLRQVNFPIRQGISEEQGYRASVFRGAAVPTDMPTDHLLDGAGIRLEITKSLAGRIPIITCPNRADFVFLVRALTHRNEPVRIPESMGALLISGYNNWARIELQRDRHIAEHGVMGWPEAFKRLLKDKPRYQDRLIVVSEGPYSGVSAASLGLDEQQWLDYSLRIRVAHECTHYFSRRFFSSMRDNLFDELLADYAGIVAAIGRFRADWWLRFMGLEDFPAYRRGGRLENYLGEPELSAQAFSALCRITHDAAKELEQAQNIINRDNKEDSLMTTLQVLATLCMDEIARPGLLASAMNTHNTR